MFVLRKIRLSVIVGVYCTIIFNVLSGKLVRLSVI